MTNLDVEPVDRSSPSLFGWTPKRVREVAHQQPLALTATIAVAFVPGSPFQRVLGIVATLALLGVAERRLGWRRALLAAVVGSAAAAATALITASLVSWGGIGWSLALSLHSALVPVTPALGAIMATSAVLGPLWRRRIRLLGFAGIIALVLYNGHPGSFFALSGAIAGLAIGPGFRPRGQVAPRLWSRSSQHESRILLSGVVAITALGPLITVTTHAPSGVLAPLGALFQNHYSVSRAVMAACPVPGSPGLTTSSSVASCIRNTTLVGLSGPGEVALSLLPLVTLLVAAALVRRGSRLAVLAAIGVNALLSALAALYYFVLPLTIDPGDGLSEEGIRVLLVQGLSVVAPFAVAVVLVVFLRAFAVRTPLRIALGYAGVVVAAFAVLTAAYVLFALADPAAYPPGSSVAQIVLLAPQRFVPLGFLSPQRLGPVPSGGAPRFLFEYVGAAFWLVLAAGLVLANRRAGYREAGDSTKADVRRLLHRGGSGSISHMSTWSGNSFWFSSDRSCVVAYRVVGSTAITVGEPICDSDRAEGVVLDFARWCDEQGLTPVFYSVTAELGPVFARLGWVTLPVAEEAMLRPQTFSLQGKKKQDIRTSINRAAASGVRAEWTRFADLTPRIARQIEAISEEWVTEKKLPELGFTLGTFDEMDDPEVRLMLALDTEDQVLAVTSWLPTWRDDVVIGWTLDVMRRRGDSMNGVMEFLIASVVARSATESDEFVSLSAAPLAVGSRPTDGLAPTGRLLVTLGRVLESSYGFRSLLAFKTKFQPEMSTLLMAYPDPLHLPVVGTALARAYLPTLSGRQLSALLTGGARERK